MKPSFPVVTFTATRFNNNNNNNKNNKNQ